MVIASASAHESMTTTGSLRYALSSADPLMMGIEPAASASKTLGAGSPPLLGAQAVKEVSVRKAIHFS